MTTDRTLLPDATVETFGGACPTQATGTIDGVEFYFRYRNGTASIEMTNGYCNTVPFGGPYDGVLGYISFVPVFNQLLVDYEG